MEAIFADSIDLTFVGPSPAIKAYAKARGEDIRIIAHCRKSRVKESKRKS
jgi:NitT/TauT family transport system substrate-binding protein